MTRARMPLPAAGRGAADCRRHRATMLDLLEDPQGEGIDSIVMDALRACERCRTEIEDVLLGSYAVQRAWRAASTAEPPDATWPRLREMARRTRGDAWRGRAHVLGIGMSAVLVALLSSSQLGAALRPGGGAALGEPVRSVPADRRYEPPPSAASSLVPAPETLRSGAHLTLVPSRKVTRTIAADRPSARGASVHAPQVRPARSLTAPQPHPATL